MKKIKAALGTWSRAFATAFLTIVGATGRIPDSKEDAILVGKGAIAALIPVVINALNKADRRYGIGSGVSDPPPQNP